MSKLKKGNQSVFLKFEFLVYNYFDKKKNSQINCSYFLNKVVFKWKISPKNFMKQCNYFHDLKFEKYKFENVFNFRRISSRIGRQALCQLRLSQMKDFLYPLSLCFYPTSHPIYTPSRIFLSHYPFKPPPPSFLTNRGKPSSYSFHQLYLGPITPLPSSIILQQFFQSFSGNITLTPRFTGT